MESAYFFFYIFLTPSLLRLKKYGNVTSGNGDRPTFLLIIYRKITQKGGNIQSTTFSTFQKPTFFLCSYTIMINMF